MFGDFSDTDFARVILSVEKYDLSCKDLVNLSKDKGIPFKLVSNLVNIQRKQYGLPLIEHADFRDICLDTIVSGNEYFFNSENIKLVLATVVTVYDSDGINFRYLSRIIREVKKILSFKINFQYDISEYLEELLFY